MIDKDSMFGFSEARAIDDLAGAASGHGGYCPEGVPVEFALLSILAAFGVAFGFLYRALTLTTGARKIRGVGSFVFSSILGDLAWAGTNSICQNWK
jgi:hypothetical protein